VHALELDEAMVALLTAELAEAGVPAARARVQRADLARLDFAALVGEQPMVFVGNLPYQVTSLVLFGLLPALARPAARGAVVMVQAEVAARLAAPPGGKEYGVLTVLLGARLAVRRLFTVRPGAFLPPPRVDSAVVQLTPRPDPVELGEAGVALVKELFAERRKQIGGLLRKRLGLAEAEVERMAQATGLEPRRRAETLDLREFAGLSRWLTIRERRG
jgi:16S rRNA (adenine1518-N6/adenine1519-N6)-dimethyltransferase